MRTLEGKLFKTFLDLGYFEVRVRFKVGFRVLFRVWIRV